MTSGHGRRDDSTRFPLALAIVGAVLLGPGPVFAEGLVLEEIIVTAQKREESLQETPVSVSAFTAEAIIDRGIANIADLADFTPNLIFDTTSPISGLSSGAVVFIRGIGNTDFSLTTDPGVGLYVDGIYMSRSVGGVLDVLDVERIEVLRGPQGTLFGRNTIGGAISISSRSPADEFRGDIELSGGNQGRLYVRASVDIPFSESLRSTFAVSSKNRDGYVDRLLVGDELGDEDRLSFRAKMVFEPNDVWDFELSFDATKIDEQSAASTILGFTPGAGTLGYALAIFGDIPSGLADLNQYILDGTDESFATGVSGTELDIWGVSLITTYHASSFDIKYTVAVRDTEGEFFRDPDNTPFTITETLNPDYDHEQTSHELQVTATAFNGRLKYVGGLYYFKEKGTDNVFVPVFLPAADPPGSANLVAGFPAGISNFADVDNSSKAAYLQVTWDLGEVFSVTGGVRQTRDKKGFVYTQYIGADIDGNPLPFFPGAVNEDGVFTPGLLPLVGNGSGSTETSFSQPTFKFGVDARLSDRSLLYYSFSQGFKSGGFVLRYVESVPDIRTFEPETVDTHEMGLKWQGFDDRVRINSAVFYSDYKDVQVTFFDRLGGPITANAGTVDIKGFELEFTALLSDRVQLDLGYGYMDTKYKKINAIPGLSLSIDETAKLVNTPENTFNMGLQYTVPLGANELAFRVDYSYTDDIFNDSQNSPFLFQKAYSTWNASTWFSIGESTDLVAFVKNLTDERFIESGDSNFGLGFHEANFNRPREYGLTIRYRF